MRGADLHPARPEAKLIVVNDPGRLMSESGIRSADRGDGALRESLMCLP
ncbi:MAG: hypothetical protein IPJ19_20070 [Planctomycetes bacterium]|nr:hypothetical protein [Planctomycetota bacterium]